MGGEAEGKTGTEGGAKERERGGWEVKLRERRGEG